MEEIIIPVVRTKEYGKLVLVSVKDSVRCVLTL